jgi:hypothetical protein
VAPVQVLSTTRIGQLTGSTRLNEPKWEDSVDAMGWPLLNETGRWGVMGADLGANTEYGDGRLYFFFGDVAVEQDSHHPFFSYNPNNSDFVAWTDDKTILQHGGHLAQGWNFFLPNDHQGATDTTGQKDWRFCVKCAGLFWAPNGQAAGICPKGGAHAHHPASWNFYLPNDHQGATGTTGQKDWRFCPKCHGLFWAPNGDPAGSICPEDSAPHAPVGWNFYLPNDHQGATDAKGQKEWRFCAKCHGLFWNDDAFKGLCLGAKGGGFHLHAVLKHEGQFLGKFAPFTIKAPIGQLLTNETPTGAFRYGGQVYVFIWVGNDRDQLHPKGSYLVSKRNPGDSGELEIEFLFSRLAANPCGFWQVAPCVVKNAEHPLLPPSTNDDGLVLFGHGANVSIGTDAIHLAWMPLKREGRPVRQEEIRYYTGVGNGWSEDPKQTRPLPFDLLPHYTSVSAAWVPQMRRWILLYSTAINSGDFANYKGQIVARISSNLREWSEPITLFDPERVGAYGQGKFMHWPGDDSMNRDIPPLPPFEPGSTTIREDKPGWAYGAFILNRFTDWDEPTRVLKIYYLLSTGSPYQVHLMHTRLRIPDEVIHRSTPPHVMTAIDTRGLRS